MPHGALWRPVRPPMKLGVRIVLLRQSGRFRRCPRQGQEKPLEPLGFKNKARRKLPEDRAQFFPEPQRSGSKEICQGNPWLVEPPYVRNESRPLQRKQKAGGRLLIPRLVGFRS